MDICIAHGDKCRDYLRSLVGKWYPETNRAPRRSREQVAVERREKAEAIAKRREFYAKRRINKGV